MSLLLFSLCSWKHCDLQGLICPKSEARNKSWNLYLNIYYYYYKAPDFKTKQNKTKMFYSHNGKVSD